MLVGDVKKLTLLLTPLPMRSITPDTDCPPLHREAMYQGEYLSVSGRRFVSKEDASHGAEKGFKCPVSSDVKNKMLKRDIRSDVCDVKNKFWQRICQTPFRDVRHQILTLLLTSLTAHLNIFDYGAVYGVMKLFMVFWGCLWGWYADTFTKC